MGRNGGGETMIRLEYIIWIFNKNINYPKIDILKNFNHQLSNKQSKIIFHGLKVI